MNYLEWFESLESGAGVVSGSETYNAGFEAAKAEVQALWDEVDPKDFAEAVASWLGVL